MVSHLLLLSCELDFSRKGAPRMYTASQICWASNSQGIWAGIAPLACLGLDDIYYPWQSCHSSTGFYIYSSDGTEYTSRDEMGSPLPKPLAQMQSIMFGPQGFDASHCLCHLEHFWARLWTSLLPHLWKKVNDTSSVGWLVWRSNRTALSKCL